MAKNRRISLLDFEEYADSINDIQYLNELLLDEPNKGILDFLFHQTESALEFVPSCSCHFYAGQRFEGHVCPYCGDMVSSEFVTNYSQKNWVRIPETMPPILHPVFYLILKGWAGRLRIGAPGTTNAGKHQKVPIIDFILDPEETLPDDLKEGIPQQGFTYFIEHFDEIMHFLFYEHPKFSTNKKTAEIIKVYEEYRDKLIIRRFPILHQSFHPMHSTKKVKHADKVADIILPAIIDLANATFSQKRAVTKRRFVDRQLWSIYQRYIAYIKQIIEVKIGDKYALIRRHAVAARIHWSGRGVISPLVSRHMGDEVHLPWDIGLNGLKLEILNLLVHRAGYTPTEALAKFMKGFTKFDNELYGIIKTLIKECPYKGLPITFGRNPTLIKPSIQFLYATFIKPDIHDKSINMSPRICGGFNADFDGKNLSPMSIL